MKGYTECTFLYFITVYTSQGVDTTQGDVRRVEGSIHLVRYLLLLLLLLFVVFQIIIYHFNLNHLVLCFFLFPNLS